MCGLIVAAIPIIYSISLISSNKLMEYRGSAPGRSLVAFTYLLVLPLMLSVVIYKYKKNNGGFLKLEEALIIGLKVLLVAVVLIIGYDILFNTFLAPSFYEEYYELYEPRMLEEFMEPRGNDEDPLREFENAKSSRIQHLWSTYVVDIILAPIIYLITATIAGLIMRTKKKQIKK